MVTSRSSGAMKVKRLYCPIITRMTISNEVTTCCRPNTLNSRMKLPDVAVSPDLAGKNSAVTMVAIRP